MIDTSPEKIFRNNENFFLKKTKLKELLNKKASFGKERGVTYKNLYLKNPEYFENLLKDSVKKLVRTDVAFDGLLLYANFDRIRMLVNDLEIDDNTKYKIEYKLYIPQSIEEIEEILNNYRLFDIETTGLGMLDQIIQFGIGIFENKRMVKKAEFYVQRYKSNIPKPIIELTGITNEIIDKEGKRIDLVLDAIYKLLHDQVVVRHNISFDMDKIIEMFVDFKRTPPIPKKIIDSIDMFKFIAKSKKIDREIKNMKLDTLTKFFTGIDIKTSNERHTSLFDVSITHNVLLKALEYKK